MASVNPFEQAKRRGVWRVAAVTAITALSVCAALAMALLPAKPAGAQEVTPAAVDAVSLSYSAVADAHVYSLKPTENYGSELFLGVQADGNGLNLEQALI
ncbi:MAG: hypothetical protein ACRC1H_13860, partial [Caldilineaceae bacterium]